MATYVAVFALVLAYVALVAAYVALRTLAKLRRAASVLAKGARGPEARASLIEATHRNTERTELLTEEIADLRGLVADSMKSRGKDQRRDHVQGALANVALVRYDAFGELSGRLSFSLALLDDNGDGVTISAIAGSADTRVYAKAVADGKGEHELSPEEQQAVSAAVAKRRGLLGRKAG
ncbi:MAG: hypothetical protein QOI15_2960 [Pseudonocardiales bacterium]|jgi:hypothetical protein|nr:hypothetical protein [Pseudonocardiales bacterium]